MRLGEFERGISPSPTSARALVETLFFFYILSTEVNPDVEEIKRGYRISTSQTQRVLASLDLMGRCGWIEEI